jgi:hypothetical protein
MCDCAIKFGWCVSPGSSECNGLMKVNNVVSENPVLPLQESGLTAYQKALVGNGTGTPLPQDSFEEQDWLGT